MGSLSRLSKKCRECPFKEKCSKKRIEAEGYLPEPVLASATMPSIGEMADVFITRAEVQLLMTEGMKFQISEEINRKLDRQIERIRKENEQRNLL